MEADCPRIACDAFLFMVASGGEVAEVGVLNLPKIKLPRPGCDVLAEPGVSRGIVLVPPTTSAEAEVAREMTVPETVMAGEPGLRVWPSIMYSEALLGAIVLPAILRVGNAVIRGIVLLPPIMSTDIEGARMTDVPAMVTAWEPGWRV